MIQADFADYSGIDKICKICKICDSYCGVMKSLADMPPRLGGGDNRINEA
jgi:hypothetical protein